ncbi:MAG TPA: hypothetical protein VGX50_10520 [Longimicrobium sp.]|jgi:hypothetical protein|nr:hypothetical protein [Longimicrobium sp.]
MSFETPAIIVSLVMISTSILTVALSRRSNNPATGRTITITIEDSTGHRARVVTQSNRRVDEVKRDFERLVAQPS